MVALHNILQYDYDLRSMVTLTRLNIIVYHIQRLTYSVYNQHVVLPKSVGVPTVEYCVNGYTPHSVPSRVLSVALRLGWNRTQSELPIAMLGSTRRAFSVRDVPTL